MWISFIGCPGQIFISFTRSILFGRLLAFARSLGCVVGGFQGNAKGFVVVGARFGVAVPATEIAAGGEVDGDFAL